MDGLVDGNRYGTMKVVFGLVTVLTLIDEMPIERTDIGCERIKKITDWKNCLYVISVSKFIWYWYVFHLIFLHPYFQSNIFRAPALARSV